MVDVVDTIRANTAEIAGAKQQLIDIQGAMSKELDTYSDAEGGGTIKGTDGTPSTVLAEKQKLAAGLDAQTARQRMGDTVDYPDYSNEILSAIKDQGAIKDQHIKEIQRINDGNVLEQIAGIFTIPYHAAKAQTAEYAQQSKVRELSAVNSLMQSSAKTSSEIQTRVTEATNASVQEALANDQRAVAAKAKVAALQTGAQNIKDVLSLSEAQVRNKIKEFEIGEAQDMRALRKAQIDQMMEIRKHAQDNKAAADTSIDFINHALVQSGKAPISQENRAGVLDQLNKAGPGGDMLRELYQQGLLGTLSGGKFVQGSTPIEAAAFRDKVNYTPQTAAEQETLSAVDGIMKGAPGVKEAKSNAEKINAANIAVQAKLDHDQDNISTDSNSLAKPISWATMAASDAFRENRVFKEIISPQITDNISMQAIDPADLFKRLDTAVKKNQVSLPEAASFYQLYGGVSVTTNNEISGLRKLTGLEQTRFRVKLPQPRIHTLAQQAATNALLAFPGMPSFAPNIASQFLPQTQEAVDGLNYNRLLEAFTKSKSGESKDPLSKLIK